MALQMLIIGCGNMGGAMLSGWLAAGLPPERFAVLDPALESVSDGVALYRSPQDVPGGHNAVLLGFKPHQLAALAPRLQSLVGAGVALHSMLGGMTLAQLVAAFPLAQGHVRVMPNLAVRINKSPIILAQTGLDPAQREAVFAFYDPLGSAVWLEEESHFDLLTALAGSGPGFVYRFVDALAKAAIRLGAQPEEAQRLALAMVEGAAALAAGAQASPATMADQVASPDGMTREGLNVLDADNALIDLLTKTLDATAKRGAELSQGTE